MKLIAVTGSPHPNGPSITLTERFIQGAVDAGHQVVRYDVNELPLRGCQGCRHCKENDADCILRDGLSPYWQDLHECGALLISGPNYCAQLCGPLITYMNRHYCLIRPDGTVRVHPGIKLYGIFSQGHGDAQAYRSQYQWFLHDFENRRMVQSGLIIHTSQSDLDELMQQAYDMGKHL